MTTTKRPFAMAFPVKTIDQVPVEDVRVWAQFAEMAAMPEAFRITADALFALSWELRASEASHRFEEVMAEHAPSVALISLEMLVHDLRCAVNDWTDVVRLLQTVSEQQPQADYQPWLAFAISHAEQDDTQMREVCSYATGFCQHYDLPLPMGIHKQLRELQMQTALPETLRS